jgi:Rps23 Pro-64 3,4-dihydroxylase Tpa1-like proline 4-hydroxylase
MQTQGFDNFLDQNVQREVIVKTLRANNWLFGGHSNTNDAFTFWYLELINDPLFTETIFNKLKQVTGKEFELNRVYANGQTHGLCGSFHVDSPHETDFTFLYYVNPYWDAVWGGSTQFYDPISKTVDIQAFTPNKGVLFKSNILHVGMEPTRHCKDLRVTVAYKLTEKTDGGA